MAFIGNSVQTQGFAPAIDYFSGNASTVTFTLSRPVSSVAQMIVSVANVVQNPASAYTVSGNSITFSSAPPSGTNNIWVEYTSLITTYAAISQSPSVIGDITASGGYFARGNFNNTYDDGTVIDYVTGNGRITVGSADAITLYNGGTTGRNALMTLDSSGNAGIGITSPNAKLEVNGQGGAGSNVLKLDGASNQIVIADTAETNTGTNWWYIYRSGGDATLRFFKNGADRMVINGSGYLTLPYQPSFKAYLGTTTSYSSGNTVVFDNTSFNVGSGYNTSTGRFTAPIAGRYVFLVNIHSTVNGSHGVQIYVNGSGQSGIYADATAWTNIGFSVMLSLAVNDYVTIVSQYSQLIEGNIVWNSFSGYLAG